MDSCKLEYGLLAEYTSAIDQMNVTHPQAGFMPSPATYLDSQEPSIPAPQTTRDTNEISKVSCRRKGKVTRPGRRGALKCARCRKQKRGRKVGYHLYNIQPDQLGSVCTSSERPVRALCSLPQGRFGLLLWAKNLS
jgi:hypothetical protein